VLLEREQDLAALVDVVAAGCGIGLVEGGAGVGKSSLMSAAAAEATDRLVLTACGTELERALGFGVVRQLLESHVAVALSAEDRQHLFDGVAQLAAGVVDPDARAAEPSRVVGDDRSLAVLDALTWVVFRIAERQPLLLIVDDAHWADESSQRALSYLSNRLAGWDVVLLAAVRTSVGSPAPAALADLRRNADAVVRPAPLSVAGVEEYLRHRLGDAWCGLAAPCHAATGGNPLFLGALLRRLSVLERQEVDASSLVELGALELAADVAALLDRAPRGVREAALALAALGEGSQVLDIAEVSGLALADVSAAIQQLVVDGLVDARDDVSFAHPVIRESVSGLLPGGSHRRVADVLASRGAGVEDVAVHLARERPSGDPRVVSDLRRAAAAAHARGASDVALALLDRARAEPAPAQDRADLLTEAGQVAAWAGRHDAVSLLRQGLESTRDPRARAQRALVLAKVHTARQEHVEAADVIEHASRELARADPELERALQLQLLVTGMQDVRLVVRTIPALTALAEWPDDPAVREIRALVEANAIGMGGGSAAATLERLLAGPPADDVRLVGWDVRAFTAFSILSTDGFEEAHRMFAEAADHAARTGSARARMLATSGWQVSAWLRGDLPTAVEQGRITLELCQAMNAPGNEIVTAAVLGLALLDRGDAGEAAAVIGAAPDPERNAQLMTCLLYCARARLQLEQAEPAKAAATIREGDQRFASLLPVTVPSPGMWSWRSPVVQGLLDSGQREPAMAEAESELRQARAWGGGRALSIALRDRARLADGAERAALLSEAATAARAANAQLELARALADLGTAHRDEAIAVARACGAEGLLASLERRPRTAGVLTPAELPVVELVAEGLTNAEVAARLHLSQATVKTHLLRAFDKLGVRNRTELARRWRDQPSG
jgi:DNA-binding CsgD family transcriptional regulator